jgi:hypothetical protein
VRLTERFDRWVHSGDFTVEALARLRIILSVFLLSRVPDFQWVTQYPSAWFTPPPGPFQVFDAFPPSSAMRAVEIAVTLCLVAMLVGYKTKFSSIAVSVLLITGYGFSYSLGKIDHNILMLLMPAVLAFSGWGGRLSVDSRRNPASGRRAEQWPVRFLALLLGVAFATAAIPKLQGGWLDPSTHAVQATLFDQYYGAGRTQYLADVFLGINNSLFWESLDYLTIALEAGLLFAVLSWRSLRVACAIACIFHLSVYLMMNIAFTANVMVYAAFVRWDLVLRLPRSLSIPSSLRWVGVAAVLLMAHEASGAVVSQTVLGLGALTAVGYLLLQTRDFVRFVSSRKTEELVIDVRDTPSTAALGRDSSVVTESSAQH